MESFSPEKILEIIRNYISRITGIEQHLIGLEQRFDEDLGLDKITFNEMADFLEDEFTSMNLGFRIDKVERRDIELVSDLVDIITSKIATNEKA